MAQHKDRRKPYGPLMAEHRVIEKAVKALEKEAERLKKEGKIDKPFIAMIIDFLRIYADRCHHGKEENILFRDLKSKSLSESHKEILQRLLDEHEAARAVVKRLESASSENDAQGAIECMKFLAWLYPNHIEIEDRHFFIPVMDYFTEDEQCCMVEEFFNFDRKQIHEKYREIAEGLEKR